MAAFMSQVFYYSGDAPAWFELEATKRNRERILLVVKARWAALGLLAFYGIFLRILFAAQSDVSVPFEQELMAGGAFVFALAYNGWCHLTVRWWERVRIANTLQLLFDLLIITYLVHFSGGVHSWFWAMYVLVTLEAAFLLESKIHVWAIGACGGLLYGGLLTAEYYDVLRPIAMPFEDSRLSHDWTYEMITWGWVSVVNTAVALIGTYLMGVIRDRQTELEHLGVRDGLTGLYNRRYFFHRLRGEIERCKRYGRCLSLMMIDVDDFKRFNDTYGHLEGDYVLKAVGRILGTSIRRSDAVPTYELDIPCRYGGEEFAIILPETEAQAAIGVAERLRDLVIAEAAFATAERIRSRVARADIHGRNVTVSVGLSTYPGHGETADGLVSSADDALYRAKERGKNRVVLASPEDKPAEPLDDLHGDAQGVDFGEDFGTPPDREI
jgi:diguanylate cyclase (GGDEF)-like protein